jgi:enoyl-CoA hydratase/carnithine racemase
LDSYRISAVPAVCSTSWAIRRRSTSRWVHSIEAMNLGLLNRLVPALDLDRELADLMGQVLSQDAGAVAAIKALLHGGVGRDRAAQLRSEREAQILRLRALGKG